LPSLPLFSAAFKQALANPTRTAIIDKTKTASFTYTQLLSDTAKLKAQIIEALELEESGDLTERRIACLVPAGYDYVVTQWATWAAGGVAVPLCEYLLLTSSFQKLTRHRHKPSCGRVGVYHRRLATKPHSPSSGVPQISDNIRLRIPEGPDRHTRASCCFIDAARFA